MASPVEQMAQKLAWELDARQSVEVRVKTTITRAKIDPLRPQDFDTIEEHYVETAAGGRTCDARYFKSDKAVNRYTHYTDGRKAADVNYLADDLLKQQSCVIKRHYFMEDTVDRTHRPHPLLFGYVGREPLSKALSHAEPLGKARVLDRDCDLFLFKKVKWAIPQDQVYALDSETGIPLRVSSFQDQDSRVKDKPLWVWEAKTLEKVRGHMVPMSSQQIIYSATPEDSFIYDFKVTSIDFDKDYPESTFWPVLQPGVAVLDSLANKTYEIPGGKSRPEGETTTTVAAPIGAELPRDWTSVAPGILVALGAAVVVIGLFLRRRR